MKIFSAQQIYEADKSTIANEQISSDMLMERAATKLFEWIDSRLRGTSVRIQLFCGIGNNGGDGIALARLLKEGDYDVQVHVVNYSEKRSKDFLINLERLKDRKLWPNFINADGVFPEILPNDVIVDAIFGIGLNRSPDEWVGNLITHINTSGAFVLSVDIPSGLPMGSGAWEPSFVIKANYVLSFQVPKMVFFLPQTGVYMDQWELLDIGLDGDYLAQTETDFVLVGRELVIPLYRPRSKFSHKGNYGHAMIIGGSKGKIGAVHLAGKACLVTGAGLVTAMVPECGYAPFQTAVPEVMVVSKEEPNILIDMGLPFAPTVIGVGMGLGTYKKTVVAFQKLLKETTSPMVIDADGLNMLSKNTDMLKDVPPLSILTPHPKELERLVGSWQNDFEKLDKIKAFSKKHEVIVVAKDAHTITVFKDKGYVNNTGNPGMATAGSGDVLMGMITALVAQGYEPLQAAIFGVYLHGLAGDMGASIFGYEALTASRILDNVGNAFIELLSPKEVENKQQG